MTDGTLVDQLHSAPILSEQKAARRAFPSGLRQPAGSYRFGMDALVLSAFAASRSISKRLKRHSPLLAVELGCGAGAAILGFSLLQPAWHCAGFEQDQKLVESARENAVLLGLDVAFCHYDVSDLPANWHGVAQIVMANPPWHREGTWRKSSSPMREKAFGNGPTDFFCGAASTLLCWHGLACFIIPPTLLCALVSMFQQNGLGLRQILPLASHTGAPASRLVCMAAKNAAPEPIILPPLALHEKNGAWSKEALEFCPWIGKSERDTHINR